ncbi:MAG: hypothetical protein ABI680_01635 [Chthoniobacteraceae bacterium]
MTDQLKTIHIKHASNADRAVIVKRIEELGGKCTGPLTYEVEHQAPESHLRVTLLEDMRDSPEIEVT